MPMLSEAMRVIAKCVASLVLLVVLATSLGMDGLPAVERKPEHSRPPMRPHLLHFNPHLHLSSTTTNAVPLAARHWRSHWHHIWGYYDWIVLHRGLGTVVGNVHNAAGAPLSGIEVLLRTTAGHPFRSIARKHITHTNEAGGFIMTRVRTGSYRVRAQSGKENNHVSVRVGMGRVAVASIRL